MKSYYIIYAQKRNCEKLRKFFSRIFENINFYEKL